MKYAKEFSQLIGSTPLYDITDAFDGSKALILAKLEMLNPAGSAKDRIGAALIADAQSRGVIKPGATIIEPTSGNTGIGLAAAANTMGYKLILTMPDSMSRERIALLRAYGARVVLTDGKKGMQGAIDKANELCAEIDGSFIVGQFDNPANPAAHYRTTGPEIFSDTDGRVDILVAGVGTGGTLSGAGKYLKQQRGDIRLVAVEPESSPMLSRGRAGAHGIMGIGANFVPKNLDLSLIDEVITVTEQQSYEAARTIAGKKGVLVGISSGAAAAAAAALARRGENSGKCIVVILPDGGERYLSTPLFEA